MREKCGEAASSRFGSVPCTWHKAMINEICRMSSGSTPRRDNANNFNGAILWVSSGELKKKFVLDTNEKISQEAARASHLKMYKPGAVVAAIYGLEAAGIRGTASIIKKQCTISQACMAFTDFKGIDNEFFYYWYILNGPRIGHRYAQGTKQQNLSTEIVGTLQICYPPLPEQRKIAAILATQDKVIELYERKIEQLQLLKKNCLRKMFPRHGSDTPEVRFRGFTGTWERKRLGDLCHFSKGYGYSKSDLKPSGKPIILYGRLYTRHETEIVEVDTFAEANNESVYSRGGDVIIPASGETAEDISIASVVKQTGIIIGGDINIIEPESTLDSTFLAISISNARLHADIARLAQGKSVVHLHCGDLAKVVLSYPCHSEQMKISTFFRHIDNIITLNQRKCDEERQKKKALMQLLLTGIVRVGEAASCRLERAGNEAAGSRFSTRIAKV